MDDELPTHLYRAVLSRKLIAIAVISYAFFPGIQAGRLGTPQVTDTPLISEAMPSLSTNEIEFDSFPEDSPMTTYARKKEHSFHPIIVRVADRHEVDPALIKAIIMAESGYNPRAISKKGAKGLMQLMPATAEALGVEDSFNPEQNIKGGVKYFKQLVIQFEGDVKLALAAYNAGSKKVRKYQGIPPFKTTQGYINKVFKYYQIFRKQSGYGADKV